MTLPPAATVAQAVAVGDRGARRGGGRSGWRTRRRVRANECRREAGEGQPQHVVCLCCCASTARRADSVCGLRAAERACACANWRTTCTRTDMHDTASEHIATQCTELCVV
jgi:hypothetical protein